MKADDVIIVRTGVANLASVLAGLRRAGAGARVSDDVTEVAAAQLLVLPGVGSFEAAMAQLRRLGLVELLVNRICEGRPTLAICLGLQLLGAGSEESPAEMGLGLFEERAARFGDGVRVPQLGWNAVTPDAGESWIEPGYAYFANSYRLVERPAGWQVAWAEHGGRFVAALRRGVVLACQFHPELSGDWGVALLRRWLENAREEALTC